MINTTKTGLHARTLSRKKGKLHPNVIKRLNDESQEQIASLQWLELQYPELRAHTFHVPNERKAKPLTGLILKTMGVRSGVSDLFIAYPVGRYHGMFVEMKSLKGRATQNQMDFLIQMRKAGYYACISKGLNEFMLHIETYLKG